ncbi:MAG: DUF1971 domain-containing protein [Gammaproteobacteria bacterium]|nr:DUF1971 domain-containing protein [Gammaproteobacteria bacterium]
MNILPDTVTTTNRTPDFDQDNVPKGILGRHTTAKGVWGQINVTEGQLTYRILEPTVEEHVLDSDHRGVVAPQMAHQVEVTGPVKFHIEFLTEM